jgi:hypothetical protein
MTERLRGVPQKTWSLADRREEIAALSARAEECMRQAESEQWLLDICKPFSERFPDIPLAELVHMLPEPERSIAFDITHPPPVKWADLPIERTNRKPWHRLVEEAIRHLDKSPSFTLQDVLKCAGIDQVNDRELWLPAYGYAKQILDATCV